MIDGGAIESYTQKTPQAFTTRETVPPKWRVGGPGGMLHNIRGVALDPKNKSVIITDKNLNGILTYYFPEVL